MNKKKNILIIYGKGESELYNRQSALGSYMLCLCNILENKDYQIYFNTISIPEANKKILEERPTNPVEKTNSFRKFIPSFIKNFIKDVAKFKQLNILKSKIESSKFVPDIIIEFYNYGSDLGRHFSLKHKCPLLIIYDAPVLEEFEFFNGKKFFFRSKIENREKKSIQHASGILVYSDPVKLFLQKKYPACKNTLFFIHQNVDYTRFEFSTPKPYTSELTLGFVGSFLKWHRVDLLLEAFASLVNEGFKLNLILAGSGLELENMKQKSIDLNIESKVYFTGFIDGEELTSVKNKMHIGIMPGSNWYGAPNKIFEYGASGLAVIAPDTPTIKYLFNNETEVLFFKWDDLNDLKEKIKRIISEEQLYFSLNNGLQSKIKKMFSPEITSDFYASMITQIMNSHKN